MQAEAAISGRAACVWGLLSALGAYRALLRARPKGNAGLLHLPFAMGCGQDSCHKFKQLLQIGRTKKKPLPVCKCVFLNYYEGVFHPSHNSHNLEKAI
jgi:hypothetical protein